MDNNTIIEAVTKNTAQLLSGNPEHFLVEIKVKPTNNIKVFLDGDKGIGIDELVRYNRALYKTLEEAGMFPEGDFSLEVSSAGLDEPLKLYRQYIKNLGRFVEVTLTDGTVLEGKLLQADEAQIVIEETKGKARKAETISHNILFDTIKTTKIQIKF